MAKERGLIRMILRDFLKSITPQFTKHIYVGEDYMGTKYYEITNVKSIHKKTNRYFVPLNKNKFDQELPAEWEAWLRNRRRIPPTEAEVNENYQMILTKRKNALELEATYIKQAEEQGKIDVVNPNAKPLAQHSSVNYPVYEEYENQGRDYKLKVKPKE